MSKANIHNNYSIEILILVQSTELQQQQVAVILSDQDSIDCDKQNRTNREIEGVVDVEPTSKS